MSEQRTFPVAVLCQNCGAEWEVDAPFKAKIEEGVYGVYIHPADCSSLGPCKGHYVECPGCGRTEEVSRCQVQKAARRDV